MGIFNKDTRPPFSGLKGRSPKELFHTLLTPCYILDESALQKNGQILAKVAQRTGCKILLAQKAFSNYNLYPSLSPYLAGTEASGLYEARLGAEEMPGKEVHVFCGAYREDEFSELLCYADHIVFNSPRQLERFGWQKMQVKVLGCESIRNVPPRRGMTSMIPVLQAAGWGLLVPSGMVK